MGQRRKGEQPVPRVVKDWPVDTVQRAMATGDRWFDAWMMQECTPYYRLTKRTKLAESRLQEIKEGSTFTRAELEALARAWWVTPEGLLATMPDPERVIG